MSRKCANDLGADRQRCGRCVCRWAIRRGLCRRCYSDPTVRQAYPAYRRAARTEPALIAAGWRPEPRADEVHLAHLVARAVEAGLGDDVRRIAVEQYGADDILVRTIDAVTAGGACG